IPRLMIQAVGVSSLVGLVAVLAFGTLYGVLGVFLAIPLTAVLQVLLDRILINVEPVTAEVATARARVHGRSLVRKSGTSVSRCAHGCAPGTLGWGLIRQAPTTSWTRRISRSK